MNFTFWGDGDVRSAAREGHSHIGCIVVHIHSKGESKDSVVSKVGNPQGIVFLIKGYSSRRHQQTREAVGEPYLTHHIDG